MHPSRSRRARLRQFGLAAVAAGTTLVLAWKTAPGSLMAPVDSRDSGGAYAATAAEEIDRLGTALDAYRRDVGAYPTTRQGLAALHLPPVGVPSARWRGPYLAGAVPVDPWGREYVYVSPGVADSTGYDLHSYGRDGREGGEGEDGDVQSWKIRPTELPAPTPRR